MEQKPLKPRITGTEMEYSIIQRWGHVASGYGVVSTLNRYVKGWLPHAEQFYANGSRIYVDCNDHVEYATPEDTSFIGTVANEIAGEQLLQEVVETRAAESNLPMQINKRVVDRTGTTWGYHESYCGAADKFPVEDYTLQQENLALLGLHLATRNIFFGAGAIRILKNGNVVFTSAQKNYGLDLDYAVTTTGNHKPVVNLRNESHANTNYSRIHVTSGDANMSPWATFVKLGSTSLVLRLIEHGVRIPGLDLGLPLVQLSNHTAMDLSLRKPFTLGGVKRGTALDIQEKLLMAAEELGRRVPLPDEEYQVLKLWREASDTARRNPWNLRDRVDWMKKYEFLKHYAAKHQLDFSDTAVRASDEQWDTLARHGAGLLLRKRLWAEWMPDAQLIASRRTTPPETTRAHARGAFIRLYADNPTMKVDWSDCSVVLGTAQTTVSLKDPYQVVSPALNRLMNEKAA